MVLFITFKTLGECYLITILIGTAFRSTFRDHPQNSLRIGPKTISSEPKLFVTFSPNLCWVNLRSCKLGQKWILSLLLAANWIMDAAFDKTLTVRVLSNTVRQEFYAASMFHGLDHVYRSRSLLKPSIHGSVHRSSPWGRAHATAQR